MNKEEILEKSRLEKDDEGLKYSEFEGIKLGFYWMSLIYSIVSIANLLIVFIKGGEMLAFYVASSMYFAFNASSLYTRYKFSQEKKYIIFMIVAIIASIVFFLNWFLRVVWP